MKEIKLPATITHRFMMTRVVIGTVTGIEHLCDEREHSSGNSSRRQQGDFHLRTAGCNPKRGAERVRPHPLVGLRVSHWQWEGNAI